MDILLEKKALIDKRINLDYQEGKIDSLLKELVNKKVITKISDELLELISRILGNEDGVIYSEDIEYFISILKYITLPFYKNKCVKKEDLSTFLKEFDKMINLMTINLQEKDYEIIYKYNKELVNVIKEYIRILDIYQISGGNISDTKIITSTLSHLVVIMYLSMDEYEYDCNVLEKVFLKIINNYEDFLYECRILGYFKEDEELVINDEQVLKDFTLCSELLKQEYCPPIKVIK